MADFEVAIRSSYRDIGRLVLDLSPGDYELSSDRRVTRWRNSAPPAWTLGGDRFSDATSDTHALRPYAGADGSVVFSSTLATYLSATYGGSASRNWTIAWEAAPGEPVPDEQILAQCGLSTSRLLIRRIRAGNHGFFTPGGPGGSHEAAGDMTQGTYVLAFDGATTASLLRDNAVEIASSNANDVLVSTIYLGRDDGGARAYDGALRSFRIWNRVLSAKELDFAFQTLGAINSAAGVNSEPRAETRVKSWIDSSGDLSLRQARRLNPIAGRNQSFRCARLPAGSAAVVQLACETDGDVAPDADLGGNLYALNVIERASTTDPSVTQDSGWSSVFDVRIDTPGHYTFLIERPNHGAVYVHLDAELG